MENKQAITNMKQGKNIPYKHETIATLITMADKLEKIYQIVNSEVDPNICNNVGDVRKVEAIKKILEQE